MLCLNEMVGGGRTGNCLLDGSGETLVDVVDLVVLEAEAFLPRALRCGCSEIRTAVYRREVLQRSGL